MLIIHRRMVGELIENFGTAISFLTVALMMEKMLKIAKMVAGKGVSFMDILKIFFFLQPSLLILTVPMAMLVSILLTYGRMVADSEVVVLKGSGMSFSGIIRPAILLSIGCFILSGLLTLHIAPKSTVIVRDAIYEIITKRLSTSIEPGVFNSVSKETVIFVNEKMSQSELMGIFIYTKQKSGEPAIVTAREGAFLKAEAGAIRMFLKNGQIHFTKGTTTTDISFSSYEVAMTIEAEARQKRSAELTTTELINEIKKSRDKKAYALLLDLHKRFSLPFACFIFALLGPPLALLVGKGGKLGGFIMSIVVFMGYYLILIFGENSAKAEKLNPFISAWTPNIVFFIIAVWLFLRTLKEKPVIPFRR